MPYCLVMTYLDCQSLESTIQSLAGVCERPADAIRKAIANYDADWTLGEEDPARVGPRVMLRALDVEIESVTLGGTYYFHGTRAIDPSAFQRNGIMPLGQVIDQIWSMLYELVRDELTETHWPGNATGVE